MEYSECEIEIKIRVIYRVPVGQIVSSRNDHVYAKAVEKAVGNVKGCYRFPPAEVRLLKFTPDASKKEEVRRG